METHAPPKQLVVHPAPMGHVKVQEPPVQEKSQLAPGAQEKAHLPPLHVPVQEDAASHPTTQPPLLQELPHSVNCLQVQFSLLVAVPHAPPEDPPELEEAPPPPSRTLDAGTLQS